MYFSLVTEWRQASVRWPGRMDRDIEDSGGTMCQRARNGVDLEKRKLLYLPPYTGFNWQFSYYFFPLIGTSLKGQYHWANGNKFVGEFRAGLPSGEGVFETQTGDVFVGSFSAGLPNGQGTIPLTFHTSPGIIARRVCVRRGTEEIREICWTIQRWNVPWPGWILFHWRQQVSKPWLYILPRKGRRVGKDKILEEGSRIWRQKLT